MSDSQTYSATAADKLVGQKLEGWNRPAVIEPDGDGELLEVAMGRTILRRTASSAWMWRSTGASNPAQAGLRLPASQPRKDCRGRQLSGFDALYRPAGLYVPDHQQLAYALAVEKLTGQEVPSAPSTCASFWAS